MKFTKQGNTIWPLVKDGDVAWTLQFDDGTLHTGLGCLYIFSSKAKAQKEAACYLEGSPKPVRVQISMVDHRSRASGGLI